MVVDRSHRRVIELYHALFLSNKLISYVAFHVGPIQTGFLMTFQKSGTGIVIPVKKHHRTGKNRNPEDSCRNRQPRALLILLRLFSGGFFYSGAKFAYLYFIPIDFYKLVH